MNFTDDEERGTTVDKWGLESFQVANWAACGLYLVVDFAELIRAVLCPGISLLAWCEVAAGSGL